MLLDSFIRASAQLEAKDATERLMERKILGHSQVDRVGLARKNARLMGTGLGSALLGRRQDMGRLSARGEYIQKGCERESEWRASERACVPASGRSHRQRPNHVVTPSRMTGSTSKSVEGELSMAHLDRQSPLRLYRAKMTDYWRWPNQ